MASAASGLPRAVTITAMWLSRSKPLKGLGMYRAQAVAASQARLVRQELAITSWNRSCVHLFPVISSS